MASRFIRRPFYGLAELCEFWAIPEEAIPSYVLERELTLSVAVARLRVETSDQEYDGDGRYHLLPTGYRWVVGTMDLGCVDAWTVLRRGSESVGRFHDPSGEVLDIIGEDNERGEMLVERTALVVRHAEKERFEAALGIGTALADDLSETGRTKSGPRGAPTKYDWEGLLCYMVVYMYDPGPPATQAALLQVCRDWFADRTGPDAVPCDSSIKSRLNRFWHKIKPDVGRPSAAVAIR